MRSLQPGTSKTTTSDGAIPISGGADGSAGDSSASDSSSITWEFMPAVTIPREEIGTSSHEHAEASQLEVVPSSQDGAQRRAMF